LVTMLCKVWKESPWRSKLYRKRTWAKKEDKLASIISC